MNKEIHVILAVYGQSESDQMVSREAAQPIAAQAQGKIIVVGPDYTIHPSFPRHWRVKTTYLQDQGPSHGIVIAKCEAVSDEEMAAMRSIESL